MTTTTTTGEKLRKAREKAGVSRARLAAAIGVSLTHLANIEHGVVPKRSDVVERAHQALKSLKEQ